MKPAMKVEDLCVDLVTRRQKKRIVDHVEFEVYPGECLGILGESGSGKSMSLKAVLGLLVKISRCPDRQCLMIKTCWCSQEKSCGN